MFHRHKWVDNGRRFIPPVNRDVKGVSESTLFRLVNGYTVVELECSSCGKISSEILLGDAT